MNKQRNVVYTKRQHALFGERLALDLDNAFYLVAEGLINSFREQNDFEGFKLSVIVNFGIDTSISEDDFAKADLSTLAEKLYTESTTNYQQRKEIVTKQALPVFHNIRQIQGNHIENVIVPFTDGRKVVQALANLQKTLDTQGRELANSLERTITLAVIDDAWKEHLRAMDDLKHSVQTAVYEQKDPLVIYKTTAFELFRNMDGEVNRDIVSFLCRSSIPVEQNAGQIREGREQKTDMSKMKVRKDELVAAGEAATAAGKGNDYFDPSEHVKQEPIKVGPKIGRNDPCPCGSGKKYKNCHGKEGG